MGKLTTYKSYVLGAHPPTIEPPKVAKKGQHNESERIDTKKTTRLIYLKPEMHTWVQNQFMFGNVWYLYMN